MREVKIQERKWRRPKDTELEEGKRTLKLERMKGVTRWEGRVECACNTHWWIQVTTGHKSGCCTKNDTKLWCSNALVLTDSSSPLKMWLSVVVMIIGASGSCAWVSHIFARGHIRRHEVSIGSGKLNNSPPPLLCTVSIAFSEEMVWRTMNTHTASGWVYVWLSVSASVCVSVWLCQYEYGGVTVSVRVWEHCWVSVSLSSIAKTAFRFEMPACLAVHKLDGSLWWLRQRQYKANMIKNTGKRETRVEDETDWLWTRMRAKEWWSDRVSLMILVRCSRAQNQKNWETKTALGQDRRRFNDGASQLLISHWSMHFLFHPPFV